MTRSGAPAALTDRLPAVRGRYRPGASLASVTWFQVGGPAEVLFKPADEADLAAFLAGAPADIPVSVIGVGSNLLVRDGGIDGVVVRLGRGFTEIRAEDGRVHVGAGALDLNVAMTAEQAGLTGLEFLSGIPGTIGGALRMNAGAYGREMVDVVESAVALDRQGRRHELSLAELGFDYRHSAIPEDWIFTGAVLKATPGEAAEIAARMAEIRRAREESQPVRARTGGSTFANPGTRTEWGEKAWQLIDAAGCRGLSRGGASVSEKHCNFLINEGGATATDLEGLGEEVRRRVKALSGISLRWEIRRIGRPAADGFTVAESEDGS